MSTERPRRWLGPATAPTPYLPRRPGPLPRLRRPLPRHLPRLFGPQNADRIVELRTARRFEEARAMSAGRSGRRWTRAARPSSEAVRRQYAEMFAAFPTPTYVTYGNVDIPALWPEYAGPGTTVLDGERVEIGGLRLRLRRRRPAHPDAHPVRDRATRSTPQGRGRRRGGRAVHPHPAGRAGADATTRSPAASSAAARPCWTRSAGPGPATPCSATSTSRWPAGCGSGRPNASTSGTSASRDAPACCEW